MGKVLIIVTSGVRKKLQSSNAANDRLHTRPIFHAKAKDDPEGVERFLRVDFRLPTLAIGEHDRCFAKSSAGPFQVPENFFLK